MLLVDQVSIALSRRGDGWTLLPTSGTTLSGLEGHPTSPTFSPPPPPLSSWITTLGLVIHSAADGIAMGAAAATREADVEFIVFLAIMLHKAPAALGLVTFQLRQLQHLPDATERRRVVRKHLLAFALAAPATALVTFFVLSLGAATSPSGDVGHDKTLSTTGVAMLFSAGTFLYVSTIHVLPEVTSAGKSAGSSSHHHQIAFTKKELLALVVGTLLPCLLAMGHHHHHDR